MDERTENRIQGWDSKPLAGGFAELRELADGGFSGAARTGGTTLFMLNGRIVGVFGGSIEDFADAQGTAYLAPHPSLPLLFAMKEHGGEQQAKYYTNDTPISEAHNQLSDAQFTGYIELSENVLSGDYYVVYYGGRSMSCAFVGNSERLEVGDEAFQLADDEVGIYRVMSVDFEVTDIPEPAGASDPSGAQAAGAQGTDGGTDTAGASADATEPGPGPGERSDPATERSAAGRPATESDPERSPAESEPAPDAQEPSRTGGDVEDEGAVGAAESQSDPAAEPTESRKDPTTGIRETDSGTGDAEPGTAADAGGQHGSDPGGGSAPADTADQPRGVETSTEPSTDVDEPAGSTDAAGASAADAGEASGTGGGGNSRTEAAADRAVEAASGPEGSAATGAAPASEGVPKSDAAYGELRPIPSLSPSHTRVAEPGEEGGAGSQDAGTGARSDSRDSRAATGARDSTKDRGGSTGAGEPSTAAGAADTRGTDVTERASQEVDVNVEAGAEPEPVPDDAGTAELRQQLRQREDHIEELEAALTDLRVQRDGLTDERDRLASEVERLEAEVSDLESEVEGLRSRLKDGTEGKQRLSREDALQGTNLFIRYDSKSGGTLDKAHRGEVEREEVNNNLRLEHHTQFDAEEVVVGDDTYDDFLRGTVYRSFVEWVVRDLLYEIQDTDHVRGLQELYEAIPQIDRAELLGDVAVQFTEAGEEYREQRSFDIVLRDRMGNPLVVANINDSRNPADREMMENVIENATDVKGSNESLSSAMMVTASFFKPGALEAADENAGGGLLSRDAMESYVKLNRKKGYHLILVESRESDFHVNVPEL